MPYPIEMQASLSKVAATRQNRLGEEFRRLALSEKSDILQNYHPDFRESGKTEIPFGSNKGDLIPNELAELIASPSRLNPDDIDLDKIDFETDVLIIGGGGGGATAALTAAENGARVLMADVFLVREPASVPSRPSGRTAASSRAAPLDRARR